MAEPKEQAKPIEAIDVPVARNDTLSDWLLSMGLQQYLGLFIVNGFDEIDFLVRNRKRVTRHSKPLHN